MSRRTRVSISLMLWVVRPNAILSAQLTTNSASFHAGFQKRRCSIRPIDRVWGRGWYSCQSAACDCSEPPTAHCTRGEGSTALKNRHDGINTGKINETVFIISVASTNAVKAALSLSASNRIPTVYAGLLKALPLPSIRPDASFLGNRPQNSKRSRQFRTTAPFIRRGPCTTRQRRKITLG